MPDVLVGLIALVLGLGVCFFGLQVFFVMLPIWGFLGGFFLGAGLISSRLGTAFLADVTGVSVGIVLGVVFAILSYLFWYAGALLAAGSTGAVLGAGIMRAIGLDANWWVWLVGLIVGVAFVVVALLLNLPVYIVLVNTALGGAATAIAGLLLLLGQIEVAEVGFGPVGATLGLGWLWTIVWVVLAVAGMLFQLRTIETVRAALPAERWVRAQPA